MAVISIARDTNNNVSLVRMEVSDTLADVKLTGYIAANQDAINILNGGTWSWYLTDMVLVAASNGNAFFYFPNDLFETLMIYGEQGSGTVNPGLANEIAYYPSNGTDIDGIPTLANAILATNTFSVPGMTQTLPSVVQGNITSVGTIGSGTWQGSVINIPYGGTGASSFTAYAVICGGTSSTGALQSIPSVGTLGQVLVSNGPGALPSFQSGIASGIINTGNQNDLPYYSASPSGKTLSAIPGAVNSVLITSGLSVPSLSQTLPSAVQANITALGTIASGTWQGSVISSTYGGTGVNNGGNTITVGGNVAFSGAHSFTGTLSGDTAVTFPTSGTLATTSQLPTGAALTKTDDTNVTLTLGGTPATALLQATSLTLGWTGQLGLTRGGTAASLTASNGGIVYSGASSLAILNGTATAGLPLLSGSSAAPSWSAFALSLGGALITAGALTTSGAFGATLTFTNTTNVTFPTSGTLATTSQIPTGAALTKVDDTNVTLTLGGSPSTALVNAASLTLGWTGQLGLTRGGTAASLTASNGGIVYSGSSALAILSGTATAGLALLSGASGAPTWSTKKPITQVVVQVFTSGTPTYTPTSGLQYCTLEVVGGGGGGGSVPATSAAQVAAGAGGGAGGYARKTVTAATIGASQTVTVGAGGNGGAAGAANTGATGSTSSVGSIVSATGGFGGPGGNVITAVGTSNGPGGVGGNGASGDFNTYGGSGGIGICIFATNAAFGGLGGQGPFSGSGTSQPLAAAGSNSVANTGSGGSGGSAGASNGTGSAGGNGGSGIVIITEFISV